jgi:hypothetical protein
MLLFGPLHVLILYGFKRIAGMIEYDEGVYEEIQRRAALVPPAQRQAAIDAMKRDRAAIGKQVMLRKKAEQDAIDRRKRIEGCIFWSVIAVIAFMYFMGGNH